MAKKPKFQPSVAPDSSWQSTHGDNTQARVGFPETVVEAGNLPRVVITEKLSSKAVAWLSERAMVHNDPSLLMDRDAFDRMIEVADVLIGSNFSELSEITLAISKRLSLVVDLADGLSPAQITLLNRRSIRVMRSEKAAPRAIAEYVLACALMLSRRAYTATSQIQQGSWPHLALAVGAELGGKTLGLIGYNVAAQATAKVFAAMGCRVVTLAETGLTEIAVDAEVHAVAEEAFFAAADVVSVHDSNANCAMSAARIARMKRGSLLINSSTKGEVDEKALAHNLKNGQLGGAALDTLMMRPLAASSPLADCPNLILTPGIAGTSQESQERGAKELVERVAAHLGVW
jgi:(S)-sulfolactate dehydrogenase